MPMKWQPFVNFEQKSLGWFDEDLFNAWVRRAVALSTPEMQAQVDAARPGESNEARLDRQRAHVLDLVRAVANAYRCIDTPPPADPEYVRAILGACNNTEEPLEGEPAQGGTYLNGLRAHFYTPVTYVDVYRAWLDDAATVQATSLTLDVQSFVRDRTDGRCIKMEGAPGQDSPWQAACFNYDCERRQLSGCDGWNTRVIVPPLWDLWLFGGIARQLSRRGARGTMTEARGYCITRNVRLAHKVGLSRNAGGAALVGHAEEMIAQAHVDAQDDFAAIGHVFETTGDATALANPLAGSALHAVGDLIGMIPRAVAYSRDGFGRNYPAFQFFRISGGTGEDDKPTQLVDDPPDFVRRPRGTLIAVAAATVRNPEFRVDEQEWRPEIWRGDLVVGPHMLEGRVKDGAAWGRTVEVHEGEVLRLPIFPESSFTPSDTGGDFEGWKAPPPEHTTAPNRRTTKATRAPKTDAPKTDAPKTDAPKTDAPKTDAPKTDASPVRVPLQIVGMPPYGRVWADGVDVTEPGDWVGNAWVVRVAPGHHEVRVTEQGGANPRTFAVDVGASGAALAVSTSTGSSSSASTGSSSSTSAPSAIRVELRGSLPWRATASVQFAQLDAAGAPGSRSSARTVATNAPVEVPAAQGVWRVFWHVERPRLLGGDVEVLTDLSTDVTVGATPVAVTFEAPPGVHLLQVGLVAIAGVAGVAGASAIVWRIAHRPAAPPSLPADTHPTP